MKIDGKIEALAPEITEWRRELHSWPETAFEEVKTSDYVAEKLKSFGLDVEQGLAKTGVVGTLQKGSGTNKDAIGLRAELDALNIQEENAFEYRSRNDGKMHACGHDGNMAMLLGAAKHLAQSDDFDGTVHFIFQPAEEGGGGGRVMVEEGLFKKYPVKSVFGLHAAFGLPIGYFWTRKGPMMAAFDTFDINISGTGGHAAAPHMGRDPILAASNMINQFQSIPSRNIAPNKAAVISVTQIQGGSTYNVIPEEVILRGTTRHVSGHVQDVVEKRMREIVDGVSTSIGVDAEFVYKRCYPALLNNDERTDQAVNAAAGITEADKIITNLPSDMGSEDFSFMLMETPGNYMQIFIGDSPPGGNPHQPKYDFNDEASTLGVAYWDMLVRMLLPV